MAQVPAEEIPTESLRYRAVMRLAYSVAMVLLMEYARESGDKFEFGPWDLQALEDQGLCVSGPDVRGAAKILAEIPGLYPSDDLGRPRGHQAGGRQLPGACI